MFELNFRKILNDTYLLDFGVLTEDLDIINLSTK